MSDNDLNSTLPDSPDLPAVRTNTAIVSDSVDTPANGQLTEAAGLHASSVNMPQPAAHSKKIKKMGIVTAVAAGIIVLLGGSAAAYYAVVVPSKPENVLKTSISNTLIQTKSKFDGKITYQSTDEKASIKAVNINFNGSADTAANAFQSGFEITAAGVKLPFEVRSIDKSLFFKIGDLSSVKGLAQAASPQYGPVIDALNKKIANQWIEADDTLVKQAKADCVTDASLVLTKQDVELLQKRYEQVPFAAVKKISDDTVNGRPAIKYELELDGNKGAEFSKALDGLSLVKKLKQCNTKQTLATTKPQAAHQTVPLTLWADKGNKQIVKLTGSPSQKDQADNKFKATFEITMQYGQASIAKPAGAKPFMEVFGNMAQLFMGNKISPNPKPDSVNSLYSPGLTTVGGVSPECLQAIQAYANSNGTKPIPANCL